MPVLECWNKYRDLFSIMPFDGIPSAFCVLTDGTGMVSSILTVRSTDSHDLLYMPHKLHDFCGEVLWSTRSNLENCQVRCHKVDIQD